MKKGYLRNYLFLLFLINFLHISFSKGQVDSLSTIEIEEILTFETSIQGLFYQIEAKNFKSKPNQLESNLPNFSLEGAFWVSDTLASYGEALKLKALIETKYNLDPYIKYYIFNLEADREAVDAYLSNLIRNEIFIPGTSGVLEDSSGDLIILGSKVPFKPFYKLKIKLLQDIKVIILVAILILFLVSSILLVMTMIFIKARNKEREILTKRFKDLTYEPLSNLLFEKTLEEITAYSKSDLEQFLPANYLSKPLFKTVLIQEIISLNKNMKGDFKLKLKLIYRKLDLQKFTLARLKSGRWDEVTTGIVESNEMDLIEALPEIEKLVASTNFYVRSNAVATQLNLSNDKNLTVLAGQKYPLSAWQQMKYLRIIKFLSTQDIVKIIFLLESENVSVRIFGIRLVRYLGRVDRIAKLSEMYPSASLSEKIEILKSFNALSAVSEIDHVHNALYSDQESLCLMAIDTLKNIGNKNSQILLIQRLEMIKGFVLEKEILTAIKALNNEAFVNVVESSEKPSYARINNHLQDPILNHV